MKVMYDNAHLVCFSPTRTSLKVGRAVMAGLGVGKVEISDLTCCRQEEELDLAGRIAVFSVPVYGGRVAETAVGRLRHVRGHGDPAVIVVVYGNRDYEDALLELRDLVTEQGFVPVAGAAFIGEHSYSRPGRPIGEHRPDARDMALAEEFGRRAAGLALHWDVDGERPELKVRGNFPYKVKGPKTPQTPVTLADLCTRCGRCIEICPVDCIRMDDVIVSDAEACIKCCACVKGCPAHARVFDTPYTDMLFKHCSVPRQPELFFAMK